MARMSHDDSVGRDSRFDHLAMLVGWSKRELVGCLQLDVWPMCYDRVVPYLAVLDIDIAANRTAISPVKHAGGFAAAMIEARLARPATKADTTFTWKPKGWKEGDSVYSVTWTDQEWRGKIYLNGTAERIAYLVRSKLSGAAGGRKSAQSRARKTQGPFEGPLKGSSKGMSDGGQGSTNPPDPDSASAPVPVPAVPTPDAYAPEHPPAPEGEGVGVVVTWDVVLENITDRYKAAYGASPIWGRQLGVLKQLCVDHGLGEVYRRTNIMFEAPPDFLRKSPCDIGTLKSNWNKLVRPTERKTSGGDNLAYLDRMSQEPA